MMKKVKVHLQSCFGISELTHDFDFSKSNAVVIYAPNGTMKTSFARTMACVADGRQKEIKDRLKRNGKVGKVEISFDGEPVDAKKERRIFVVNGEDFFDAGNSVANILADSSQHREYSDARNRLQVAYDELIQQLKVVSGDDACETALKKAFPGNSVYEFQAKLAEACSRKTRRATLAPFDHRAVFDAKGKVADFLQNNKEVIKAYARAVERILKKSKFFGREGTTVFAFGEAENLRKALAQGEYFAIGHKLVLKGGRTIETEEELAKLINDELERLARKIKTRNEMKALEKKLQSNAELRNFKSVLAKSPWIAGSLSDYEGFRRVVWRSYLGQLSAAADEFVRCFKDYSKKQGEIAEASRQQLRQWESVLAEFNARFDPPFRVSIANADDVLSGDGIPAKLSFRYLSEGDDRDMPVDALQEMLSRGEGRALRIMQIIFEIKAREKQRRETLLVFDDIVDSFDYRNKYAMVEYMKEMAESGLFKSIILTHNFDFYRLVSSRLGLKDGRHFLVAFKNKKGGISIGSMNGEYGSDVLAGWIKSDGKNGNGKRRLLAIIPFARNIAEYVCGQGPEYLLLTKCLHFRVPSDDSPAVSIMQVVDVLSRLFPSLKESSWLSGLAVHGHENYYDFLFEVAGECQSGNENSLDQKMVLAIAIRVAAEKYLYGIMNMATQVTFDRKMFGEMLEEFKRIVKEKHGIFEREYNAKGQDLAKVAIMASEYIHVNSFMYEPLIDTGIKPLAELYGRVSEWEVPAEEKIPPCDFL